MAGCSARPRRRSGHRAAGRGLPGARRMPTIEPCRIAGRAAAGRSRPPDRAVRPRVELPPPGRRVGRHRHRARGGAVGLALLHRRLRPAQRDRAPRDPPLGGARAVLPGFFRARGACPGRGSGSSRPALALFYLLLGGSLLQAVGADVPVPGAQAAFVDRAAGHRRAVAAVQGLRRQPPAHPVARLDLRRCCASGFSLYLLLFFDGIFIERPGQHTPRRPDVRRDRHRDGDRGHAPHDGHLPAAAGGGGRALRHLRALPAGRPGAPRLQRAARGGPPVQGHRGHLRHPGRRGRHLRLPLRAVRHHGAAHRAGAAVRQPRHHRRRALCRRAGQGQRGVVGPVRHDLAAAPSPTR